VRDLIGHAIDLDLDAALIVAGGALPPSEASLRPDIARSGAICGIAGDLDREQLRRLLRRFGPIVVRRIESLPTSHDYEEPAAVVDSIRSALGLSADGAGQGEPAMPDTWWP
jgi:hypothetical protein